MWLTSNFQMTLGAQRLRFSSNPLFASAMEYLDELGEDGMGGKDNT